MAICLRYNIILYFYGWVFTIDKKMGEQIMGYYKLIGKKIVSCGSGGMQMQDMGKDTIGEVFVSTVFLSLDHNYREGEPILFETMIFGGEHDQYQERCCTYDEAVKMHETACNLVKEIDK